MNTFLLNQVQQTTELVPGPGSEKLYVVVTVIGLVFLGITLFLLSIEKRLRKLEGK